jgi:uncharacterized membrane protein YeaQ/YmgE (transglycosylase-associated protein family)
MLRIGSGAVGRTTFIDAAIGDLAGPGSVPKRPSGNAALGETTTSTAPHSSVRGRTTACASGAALGHESPDPTTAPGERRRSVPVERRRSVHRLLADKRMQRRSARSLSIRRNRHPIIHLDPEPRDAIARHTGWRSVMGIISWIVVGAIAGYLAGFLVRGDEGLGVIGHIVLGIVGALVGGFLAGVLLPGNGDYTTGINIPTIIVATIGAVIAVVVVNAVSRTSRTGRGADLTHATRWRTPPPQRPRNAHLAQVGVPQFQSPARPKDAPVSTVMEAVGVDVPIRTAYDRWTQFETLPEFMDGLKSVRQLDDTTLEWVADVAGREKRWEARITEQRPDDRIAWRSIEGAHNAGVVTFRRIDDGTSRVTLQFDVDPKGPVEDAGRRSAS